MNTAFQQECEAMKFATENRFEGVLGVLESAELALSVACKGKPTERAREIAAIARTRVRDAQLAIEEVASFAMKLDVEGVPVMVPSDEDDQC